MPNPPSSPLTKIRRPRLLRKLLLPCPRKCTSCLRNNPLLPLLPLLLLPLLLLPLSQQLLPPRRLLALLAIQDQKHQGGGQTHNDQALHDTIVKIERVAARHAVVIQLVVGVIVVLVQVILDKVIDPLAKGPVFLWGCLFVG